MLSTLANSSELKFELKQEQTRKSKDTNSKSNIKAW